MTLYSWYVAVSLAAAACVSVTAQATVSQADVFINEIHYDNTGADAGESVELAGPAGVTLEGLSLHFYNGNGGGQYSTTTLAGTLPAMQSGYGVLSFATSGLQNGPDGIALVRDSDASVLQFLSYEGTITATDGPAIGLTSVDINVAQTSSTPVSESLQMCGSGSNSTDFGWGATATTASFGSINSCQSFERPTVTTCIDLKRLFRNNSCCGNASKGINLHFVDISTGQMVPAPQCHDLATVYTNRSCCGAPSKEVNLTLVSAIPSTAPATAPSCGTCSSINQADPTVTSSTFTAPPDSLVLHYGESTNYTVWLDCQVRGAYRFEYNISRDCGCLPRLSSFKKDRDVPELCQQNSSSAYPSVIDSLGTVHRYDRGHQVPANHLDSDQTAIAQSQYMTNVLPQASLMNRGSWLATEEITECYRDLEPLHVLGGAVYNSTSPRATWFLASHGIQLPVAYWKVITASTLFPDDFGRIAFFIPNEAVAVRSMLDEYVVSLSQLETLLASYNISQVFDTTLAEKQHTPTAAWALPAGCDKGR